MTARTGNDRWTIVGGRLVEHRLPARRKRRRCPWSRNSGLAVAAAAQGNWLPGTSDTFSKSSGSALDTSQPRSRRHISREMFRFLARSNPAVSKCRFHRHVRPTANRLRA